MWTKELNLQIDLMEVDPKQSVLYNKYDDDGNIIRRLTVEEIDRNLQELEGKARFLLQVKSGDKFLRFRSPTVPLSERQGAIEAVFLLAAKSIFMSAERGEI